MRTRMGWEDALAAGHVADVALEVLEGTSRSRAPVEETAVLELLARLFDELAAGDPHAATATARELLEGPAEAQQDMKLWRLQVCGPDEAHTLALLRAGLLGWAAAQGPRHARFALRCVYAICSQMAVSAHRGGPVPLTGMFRDGLARPWRWPALEAAAARLGVHPVDTAVGGSLGDAAFSTALGARRVMLGASPVPCTPDRWWALPEDDTLCAPLGEQDPLCPSPAFDAAATLLAEHLSAVDVDAMDPLWFARVTPDGALRAAGRDLDHGARDVFALLWREELADQHSALLPHHDAPRPAGRSLAELADIAEASVARSR